MTVLQAAGLSNVVLGFVRHLSYQISLLQFLSRRLHRQNRCCRVVSPLAVSDMLRDCKWGEMTCARGEG
jgi:hypothetical protein